MSDKALKMSEVRNSPKWKRSPLGIPIEKLHFREVSGTKHAVCDPSDGTCEVHEDKYNPDRSITDKILHAFHDLPEDLQVAIGAVSLLTGLFLLAGGKIREIVGALVLPIAELFLEFGDSEFGVLDVLTEKRV